MLMVLFEWQMNRASFVDGICWLEDRNRPWILLDNYCSLNALQIYRGWSWTCWINMTLLLLLKTDFCIFNCCWLRIEYRRRCFFFKFEKLFSLIFFWSGSFACWFDDWLIVWILVLIGTRMILQNAFESKLSLAPVSVGTIQIYVNKCFWSWTWNEIIRLPINNENH